MSQYQVDKVQLKQLIKRDCEVFLGFYLGEELTLDVPEFHCEIWDDFLVLLDKINEPERLTGTLKKLLGVPREHSKTTLTKLAVILFMRYSKLSFCAYISNTFPSALNAIKDIKEWLTSSQEVELYGQPAIRKSSETDGLYIIDIHVPGRETLKTIILKCFGAGTQIRGTLILNRRPDLLIFDDIESNETASSPAQQEKLDTWALGTALKSMGRLGICIFIGNMIRETTLLARLSKEPEWDATVFGCLIRNKNKEIVPLWEGRWTFQALLDEYASYRRIGNGHIWEAEMMNLTNKDILGESLANIERPICPTAEEIEGGFICLDPAFGLKSWHDESAVTVHVRMHGGDIPVVADSWHGRVPEERVFDQMLSMSMRWGITTWVIESVAAQRLLISLFRMFFVQRGMSPDLIVMLPITAGKESKASRIVAFRNSVLTGSYAITEDQQELTDKLEEYAPDNVKHDDLCDSAAYGLSAWNLFGTLVKSQGRQDVLGIIMGTTNNDNQDQLSMMIP